MPTIHFVEGPCDGTTRVVTQATLSRGSVVCQGTVYVNAKAPSDLTGGQITYVPATSGYVTGADRGPPGQVTQVWTRWMRILRVHGAASHKRLVKASRRANRIAR